MMSYSIGHLIIAYLMMVIVAAMVVLLWFRVFLRRNSYRRRFQGWRLTWEMWLGPALLSIVLAGWFYWYLFWHSFYKVTVLPNDEWLLTYSLPAREVRIAMAEISALQIEDDFLPGRTSRSRQYVIIKLRDGETFYSAPASPHDSARFLQQLHTHLPRVPIGPFSATTVLR